MIKRSVVVTGACLSFIRSQHELLLLFDLREERRLVLFYERCTISRHVEIVHLSAMNHLRIQYNSSNLKFKSL